jgi:type II secretory pathway component PulF
MPYFRYTATDPKGQVLSGTIDAPDAEAARFTLGQRGFQVRDIDGAAPTAPRGGGPIPQIILDPAASVSTRPVPAAPTPVPAPRSAPPPPSRAAAAPPARPAPPSDLRIGRSDKRTNFFIFSQLASYARSGVAPHQAYEQIAQQQAREDYRRSLMDAAAAASNGEPASDVFDRYDRLYEPHIAGALRCAEVAGFVPEALARLADHQERSHRFRRKFLYLTVMLLIALAMIPIGTSLIRGALETISRQWEADGQLPAVETAARTIGESLVAMLPYGLAGFVLLAVLVRVWNAYRLRPLRHRLVLALPGLGNRVRAESLAWVAYCMTQVSKAGISPQRTLELAAGAAPNLAVRDELLREARGMREAERLSSVLLRSRLVPETYAMMVQNGELTGDVPGALESVAKTAASDYDFQDDTSPRILTFALYVVVALIVGTLVAYMAKTWYMGLFERIQ